MSDGVLLCPLSLGGFLFFSFSITLHIPFRQETKSFASIVSHSMGTFAALRGVRLSVISPLRMSAFRVSQSGPFLQSRFFVQSLLCGVVVDPFNNVKLIHIVWNWFTTDVDWVPKKVAEHWTKSGNHAHHAHHFQSMLPCDMTWQDVILKMTWHDIIMTSLYWNLLERSFHRGRMLISDRDPMDRRDHLLPVVHSQ